MPEMVSKEKMADWSTLPPEMVQQVVGWLPNPDYGRFAQTGWQPFEHAQAQRSKRLREAFCDAYGGDCFRGARELMMQDDGNTLGQLCQEGFLNLADLQQREVQYAYAPLQYAIWNFKPKTFAAVHEQCGARLSAQQAVESLVFLVQNLHRLRRFQSVQANQERDLIVQTLEALVEAYTAELDPFLRPLYDGREETLQSAQFAAMVREVEQQGLPIGTVLESAVPL